MKYGDMLCGEDFIIDKISNIERAKSGNYYREITFDKHPNPELRNNGYDVPPVREFHKDEEDFIELKVGQILHNVTIYSKLIGKSVPGRYYTLGAFNDNIVYEK